MNIINKKIKIILLEKRIYLTSLMFIILTILINIANIINTPKISNLLILEINILISIIIHFIYTIKIKKINRLNNKLLEQKIKYIKKDSTLNRIIFHYLKQHP